MAQSPIETGFAPWDVLGGGTNALFEVVEGREVVSPLLGAFENLITAVLTVEVGIHAKQQDLGRVVTEGLFRLSPATKTMRRPDVAFLSHERWGRDRKVTSANGLEVVPNLAVEILSPTDLAVEVFAKVREYLNAGVVQVWLIHPRLREVHVFEGATGCRIVRGDDTLDGGTLLPGFRLTLAELFRDGATDEHQVV